MAAGFQKLSIFNTGRTNLLTRTTTETAIDVLTKRLGSICYPAFGNRAHQVEPSAWAIVLVAGYYVSRTRLQAEPAMDASEKFLFFVRECVLKS